jgi:seryl-tRNA synthetase
MNPDSGETVVQVRTGLATVGPEALELRAALEERFLDWAAQCGAAPRQYPALMRVEDLSRIEFFKNFPHLAIIGSSLTHEAAGRFGNDEPARPQRTEIDRGDLADAGYVLPSAACYNIYFSLAGTRLPGTERTTTVATCFRRENHYEGLRRLLGFSMREIVCIGTRDDVLDHLGSFKKIVSGFLERLDLPVKIEAATDPFFEAGGSRALMTQLFPTKEEFVFDGSLAIGSMNFHRNFFGERCEIRTADDEYAFTGCVAFGIERWIAALTSRHGSSYQKLTDLVRTA